MSLSSLSAPIPPLYIQWISVVMIITKRQHIHDMTANRTQFKHNYDFVVIGAGSAGTVVSCRLSEHWGERVLVLEAGGAQNAIINDLPGMYTNTLSELDTKWDYYHEPQYNYGLAYKDQ